MERENKEYERGAVITQHDYKDEALYTREMFASIYECELFGHVK
jgi:hypothetical protein